MSVTLFTNSLIGLQTTMAVLLTMVLLFGWSACVHHPGEKSEYLSVPDANVELSSENLTSPYGMIGAPTSYDRSHTPETQTSDHLRHTGSSEDLNAPYGMIGVPTQMDQSDIQGVEVPTQILYGRGYRHGW